MIISWGKKIFILYTTFACAMIFLVYQCCQVNYDLVSKDYYNEELAYQQLIDGSARSSKAGRLIEVKQVDKGVQIDYQGFSDPKELTGECHFYFAPDAAVDFKIQLNAKADSTQFVEHEFKAGPYILKFKWNAGGQFYYQEKKLRFK